MKLNQIIVNPKKSQAMFISKKKNALPKDLKLQINKHRNNDTISSLIARSHN